MAIKELRVQAGMKQIELAMKIGVSQGAVSQWEKGYTMPKADLLPKIAQILNCTIDELLKNNECDCSKKKEA